MDDSGCEDKQYNTTGREGPAADHDGGWIPHRPTHRELQLIENSLGHQKYLIQKYLKKYSKYCKYTKYLKIPEVLKVLRTKNRLVRGRSSCTANQEAEHCDS